MPMPQKFPLTHRFFRELASQIVRPRKRAILTLFCDEAIIMIRKLCDILDEFISFSEKLLYAKITTMERRSAEFLRQKLSSDFPPCRAEFPC
jgi:hypothetical protein